MRIDVHAHYYPARYLDALRSYGSTTTDVARGQGAGDEPGELEARLELMDEAGVHLQLLSVSPQLPSFHRQADAVAAARFANDLHAGLVSRQPTRFAALAATPLPHLDAALAELERALDELGMRGVTVATSVLGRSIADPKFEPFFAELDRRGALLFVHPAGMNACSSLIQGAGLTWMVGEPVEDTLAIVDLITKGVLTRFPNIRFLFCHLGGALPMLLGRLDHQAPWEAPRMPELPSRAARRAWYDTASHGFVPALRCACDVLGSDRLVLGTDFPYNSGGEYVRSVQYIHEAGLANEEAQSILEGNASKLLGMGSLTELVGRGLGASVEVHH